MSNEWLNDLRNKMENHTEDVPDELWNDIREELFGEDDAKTIVGLTDLKAQEKPVPKTGNKTLLYRIGGVAAIIVMFLTVGKLLDFNGKNEPSGKSKYSSGPIKSKSNEATYNQELSGEKKNAADENSFKERNELNIVNSNISNDLNKNTLNAILNPENKKTDLWEHKILNSQKPAQSENLFNQNNNSLAQEENKNAVEGEKTNETVETHELLTKEEQEWKEKFEEEKKLAKNKDKKSWMVSLFTGNASSNASNEFPGYATLNGTTLSLPEIWGMDYGEDPLMAILIANQNMKVDAKIKHKTPVTFGASVYYSLGKKWGITTGVNYTKLAAELTTGSSSNFISSEQNIHYVGIPVQVNYNVIQKGIFTGYIAGGGVAEKAVSGDIKTKYIVDGTVKEETKENISEKPVQVSVNGAIGLQLKLIKNLGVYAEPGVSYHFDDNSSLNTIYKEKPLNFNLKFGIRLLLN